MRSTSRLLFFTIAVLMCSSLGAQQTGAVSGRVTAGNAGLPGVTVEARSNVLPQPRVTVTDSNGDYRLPALQPGAYTLTFTLSGMQTVTRRAEVLLGQVTPANVEMGVQGLAESITVTAATTLVDRQSTEIKGGLTTEEIRALPAGQEYRDLIKFVPGVMVTEDQTRGPSSGASGQDNVYQFDGVNVSLPQYGTLAAEPATHDIAQVSVVKGGAKAVDFNRAGGFTIDSVSKSGTNRFSGEASFQVLNHGMTADLTRGAATQSRFNEDRTWAAINLGGPILPDRLFFYGSYFRPTRTRANRANAYGALPEYESKRNEGFGKLTFTPLNSVLLNTSYRDSKRADQSSLFGPSAAATTGTGTHIRQKIGILEASWVINSRSFATAKFNHFDYLTTDTPDFVADARVSTAIGSRLDIAKLATLGGLTVPLANSTNAAVNAFRQQFIDRYGFTNASGVRAGGGSVGYATTFDKDDFFRRGGQVGYNLQLGSKVTHDFHAGFQTFEDAENLARSSNGFGSISIPGGSTSFQGKPIFFQAAFQQQSGANLPPIHSELKSENLEINDTISWNNWSFNAGVLASHDTYYGQGLERADNIAGFVAKVGSKYEMYDIPWDKMIQPRLGATWAYNGRDTVYTSFALYNPAASSLPRAASWDRNLRQTINAYFDENGVLFAIDPVRSSSGKLFLPDMKPRTVHEYMIGTSKQIRSGWSGRLYTRYKKTDHFWEDTPNDARIASTLARPTQTPSPSDVPKQLYMPDLQDRRIAIGRGTPSGDTYVIADLDGAFTRYYEATLESDWRGGNTFLRGTYTWSHYYGNFDQDGSTGCGSPPSAGAPCDDQNTFIGSSNIADAAGRQIWDNKYGDLHGDRRHLLKMYGSYALPWNASVGAFALFQSGQPWEAWDYHYYQPYVGTSTSDTIRYAEPAGSRRSPSHHQVDLNYVQRIPLPGSLNVELKADVFNVYDKQTARRYQPSRNSAFFAQPNLFYSPRRIQLSARVQF